MKFGGPAQFILEIEKCMVQEACGPENFALNVSDQFVMQVLTLEVLAPRAIVEVTHDEDAGIPLLGEASVDVSAYVGDLRGESAGRKRVLYVLGRQID